MAIIFSRLTFDVKPKEEVGEEVDPDILAMSNELLNVDFKFSTKPLYASKFIWLTTKDLMLHISDQCSKERHHKMVSLSLLAKLVPDFPEKPKTKVNNDKNKNLYLTLLFKRSDPKKKNQGIITCVMRLFIFVSLS